MIHFTPLVLVQVCEERLYNPGQAAQHYRSVCATLYSHTVELFNYLQIIRQTQEVRNVRLTVALNEHAGGL